jgi:Novel STAND NTPase 1
VNELDNPRAPVPDSPYPGLRDYTEEFADLFFGRDTERQRIIGNLRAARFTLLYGESGVGKSSLLGAGVMARLHELAERTRAERGQARYVPVMFRSWGAQPTAALVDELAAAVQPFVADPVELPADSLADALSLAAAATGATVLVILDQFEEFFLYLGRDAANAFADRLAECINRRELPANFLISIREDAYASIGGLLKGRVPNVYGNYLRLEHLDRDAARDAIVKPIERLNEIRGDQPPYEIGPDLVDAVLFQVRRGHVVAGDHEASDAWLGRDEETGVETTYLQLVMRRLWETEMDQGSRVLRLATLERLGGAQRIIATYLDQSMAELDAAASVFRFLVTSAGTKIMLTATDLSELSGIPDDTLRRVLRRLAASDSHILRSVVVPRA